MIDKVHKIREEVERLYNQSLVDENRQADRGLELAANVSYGKSRVCKQLLSFIDSLQEEPISEDLEIEIKHCIYEPFFDLDGVAVKGTTKYLTVEDIADIARHFANRQKQMTMKDALDGYYGAFYNHVFIDYDCRKLHLADGQKLKILIIKED